MPDMSGHHDRVEDFARNAPLASTSGKSKCGILQTRNGKSYTVNIRPSKWNDKNKPSQFWISQKTLRMGVLSYEWAQYFADTIYHYIGSQRVHFKDDVLIFPPLECIGTEINTPVLLTNTEIRFNYVRSIAGEGFAKQREDLIQKVTDVMKSTHFILQGERLLSSKKEAAAPREEAAVPREEAAVPREEAAVLREEAAIPGEVVAVPTEGVVRIEDDDDGAEDTPPMEDDNMSFLAIRQIQLFSASLSNDVSERVYPRLAGSDRDLVRGLDFLQAYAPSFEINPEDSGKSLRSVGQSFGLTCFTPNDCPTTGCEDKEKYESWMETIVELNTNAYRRRMEVLSSDEPELDSNFYSTASRSWMKDHSMDESELDPDFVSIIAHMTADAEHLKNAKRRRIGD